jgi:hypothetical protein
LLGTLVAQVAFTLVVHRSLIKSTTVINQVKCKFIETIGAIQRSSLQRAFETTAQLLAMHIAINHFRACSEVGRTKLVLQRHNTKLITQRSGRRVYILIIRIANGSE